MQLPRIAISAVVAALIAIGLAALPFSAANAQYYGPPCTPFPLTWPFCIVGAAVGTAATIVTAPFRAFGPPYYRQYPYPSYGYGYYGAPYYPPNYGTPYSGR